MDNIQKYHHIGMHTDKIDMSTSQWNHISCIPAKFQNYNKINQPRVRFNTAFRNVKVTSVNILNTTAEGNKYASNTMA